jgi:hypothetical protein
MGRRLSVLGGGAGLAAGATVALTLAGVGASTPRAFAGWSPSPTTPVSGQTVAAEGACSVRLPTSAELEHAQRTALGHYVPEPVPQILPGGWHPVIVDTRGPFTALLYEAAGGGAQAFCFSGPTPTQTVIGLGYGASPPTVAEGQIALSSFGSRVAPPAPGEQVGMQQEYEDVIGHAGAGVSGVTLTLSDGSQVEATVANGWFLAWWPGASRPRNAEVRTPSATRTQPLELPGDLGSGSAGAASRRRHP